jgi:hypothetical protein
MKPHIRHPNFCLLLYALASSLLSSPLVFRLPRFLLFQQRRLTTFNSFLITLRHSSLPHYQLGHTEVVWLHFLSKPVQNRHEVDGRVLDWPSVGNFGIPIEAWDVFMPRLIEPALRRGHEGIRIRIGCVDLSNFVVLGCG